MSSCLSTSIGVIVQLLVCTQVVSGGTCPSKKYTVVSDHTACLDMSTLADPANRGVTAAEKRIIVDEHNKLRASVYEATNMQMMVWDNETALIAQKWADNCQQNHDSGDQRLIPGRMRLGQNLAFGAATWQSAIRDVWFSEEAKFKYASNNDFLQVGHSTQLVWADTGKIGCGFAECSNIGKFYVCNYGKAGNVGDINKPYKRQAGSQCKDCPSKCITTGDNKGLCDCGGKVCYNGGTLDVSTCTCTCDGQPFHINSMDCALNCTDTKDDQSCGTFFTDCSANAPDYCPHMCEHCPYAAFDYKSETPDSSSKVSSICNSLIIVSLILSVI